MSLDEPVTERMLVGWTCFLVAVILGTQSLVVDSDVWTVVFAVSTLWFCSHGAAALSNGYNRQFWNLIGVRWGVTG